MLPKDRIIVLTYEGKHRKTYDTLCLLKAKGYQNVVVVGCPMRYKKSFVPLFSHRPDNPNVDTRELCKNFLYEYISWTEGDFPLEGENLILLCGAGLLPSEIYKNNKIINSHPGYIPEARGLDALKWAIVEGKTIGCSTHFLGDEVDAGEVIERRIVEVKENDTFHALAQRVYETEIGMLVEAIEKCGQTTYIPGGDNIVHRRMPKEVEKNLLSAFEQLKIQARLKPT